MKANEKLEQTGKLFNIQKFSINDGSGIRTTVFFTGCPLECRWCANPESQNRYASIADTMKDETYCGHIYTVNEVMEEVRKDIPFYNESGGGMTLSGGEPLQQPLFAMALADAARQENIHVAVETTGFAKADIFAEALTHVDMLLYDFKHCNREIHKEQTGVYNDVILENLRQALKTDIEVLIRIPIIPNFNSDLSVAKKTANIFKELGVKEVHLLPFHQFGEKKYQQMQIPYMMEKYKQLHPEDLEEYQEVFLSKGLNCTFQ